MNKHILFSGVMVATLMSATAASAQVGGGIKAGINLASIQGFNDATTSTSQRTGLVAGGFLTFGLSPMIAFQPELLFSMQGTKLHFTSSGVSTDATTAIDYVQLPLLIRVGNNSKDHASFYAIAGPTLGMLVRANEDGVDIKSDLKKTDVGVVAGVGVTLTRVMFEGRYTVGLQDLNKVQAPSGTQKNRVISFLVGLVF